MCCTLCLLYEAGDPVLLGPNGFIVGTTVQIIVAMF